jgi:O-antigen chain-terminating methyltransferase
MGRQMAPTDGDRFERERLDADRRYNDALTELDRTIVACSASPTVGRDDVSRAATALIVFLQQITALVDTKDRRLAADLAARVEKLMPALDAVAELRTQVGVLQRTTEMLKRESRQSPVVSHQSEVVSHQSNVVSQQSNVVSQQSNVGRVLLDPPTADPYKYVAFEDEFRGSDEEIRSRLAAYVPLFAGAVDVVDIGCGRGEFLAALAETGVRGRGVDANREMAAIARDRGLDVVEGDALAYLEAVQDGSLGGVIGAQVVEHFEPGYLMKVIDAAARKLERGAPLVIETINPACWLAFFSSYIRDLSHVRPVHPETLRFLLRASGFERVEIRYSAPVPEHMKMRTIDLPSEVLATSDPVAAAVADVAQTINANAVILNNLMFTHLDYAAIGYRS